MRIIPMKMKIKIKKAKINHIFLYKEYINLWNFEKENYFILFFGSKILPLNK